MRRCVAMLAGLLHAEGACGTSTIGSSEAILLGGLAMKRRWQERRAAAGKQPTAKPNMVCSAAVHVCWEKLFNYFDIEPRCVPLEPGSLCAPISKVPRAACRRAGFAAAAPSSM